MTAISKTDLDRAIAQVRDEVAGVDTEDGPAALANQYRWDLVEGSVFSTRAMDETSLCESIVNDILVAEDLRRSGRVFAFTAETLVRHLAEDEAARATALLADPTVQSYLERRSDGELRIAAEHMQDAADYCGFYPAWITPLTGETVIYAGTLPPA